MNAFHLISGSSQTRLIHFPSGADKQDPALWTAQAEGFRCGYRRKQVPSGAASGQQDT
jgi:hypothetical protein